MKKAPIGLALFLLVVACPTSAVLLASCRLFLTSPPTVPGATEVTVRADVTPNPSWPAGPTGVGVLGRTRDLNALSGVFAIPGGAQAESGLPLVRPTRLFLTVVPSHIANRDHLIIALLRQEGDLGAAPGVLKSTLTKNSSLYGLASYDTGDPPPVLPSTLILQDKFLKKQSVHPEGVYLELTSAPGPLGPLDPSVIENQPWLADELLASLPVASDERFYGDYSMAQGSLPVWYGGELRDVALKSAELELRHVGAEIPDLAGALWGTGKAVLADPCALIDHPDCDKLSDITLLFAGEVTAPGQASLLLTGFPSRSTVDWDGTEIPQPASLTVRANLSADGNDLTLTALGEALTLSKLAPERQAPEVEIVAPLEGQSFGAGADLLFVALVHQDGAVAPEKMRSIRWERRVGNSWQAFGETAPSSAKRHIVSWRPLSGTHEIRVVATNEFGIAAQDTVAIHVATPGPLTPEILQPAAGASIYVQAPVVFLGRGYDPDDGFLQGASLTWTYRALGSGPWQPLGPANTGVLVEGFQFPSPGQVEVRLTATDSEGQSASATRVLDVLPPAANTPPVVLIQEPDPALGSTALTGGETRTLSGRAADAEEPAQSLAIEWILSVDGGPPVTIGTAPTIPSWTVPDDDPTHYRPFTLTLRAKDSGGLTGSHTIQGLLWGSQSAIE